MSKKGKETKEKKQEETKKEEKKKETAQEEKKEIVYQAAPDPTMTFYTGFAILAALVSVAATAFSMMLLSDPVIHPGNTIYGKVLNAYSMVALEFNMESDGSSKPYIIMATVAMVLITISALISLFVAIRSINPNKKPLMLIGIASFAFALAGLLILIFGHFNITAAIRNIMGAINPGMEDLKEQGVFDVVYYGNLIAAAANVLFSGINVFGILYGYNRFVRDGKAF